MRIGIEAQRIFRKNKHGMDYVVLQEIISSKGSQGTEPRHVTLYEQHSPYPLQGSIDTDTPRHHLLGTKRQEQQIALPEHGVVLPEIGRAQDPQEMPTHHHRVQL